jgi:hypothetical protein
VLFSLDLLGDGHFQALPDLGQRHPVQHLLKEPEDDELLGFLEGDTAALDVEEGVLVDGTDAGGVATPDRVVGQDLQVRD